MSEHFNKSLLFIALSFTVVLWMGQCNAVNVGGDGHSYTEGVAIPTTHPLADHANYTKIPPTPGESEKSSYPTMVTDHFIDYSKLNRYDRLTRSRRMPHLRSLHHSSTQNNWIAVRTPHTSPGHNIFLQNTWPKNLDSHLLIRRKMTGHLPSSSYNVQPLNRRSTSAVERRSAERVLAAVKGNATNPTFMADDRSQDASAGDPDYEEGVHIDEYDYTPVKNIVAENPSLDVGPLVWVSVGRGDTARLPCTRRPLPRDDAVRLVLWYRNQTDRPLLSFDSREELLRHNSTHGGVRPHQDYPINSVNSLFAAPRTGKSPPNEPRLSVSSKGRTLVIRHASQMDQAEYRCTVHFSRSPATTHRLRLTVESRVSRMSLVNAAGQPVGTRVGPFTESHRLTLTCRAEFRGRLVELQWLVGGAPVSSSWNNPRPNFAESLLDITLEPRHAGEELTCRLITARGRRLPGRGGAQQRLRDAVGRSGANITDLSTVVMLKYLPRVRLELAEPRGAERAEGAQGGVSVGVREGGRATLICRVRASPPPYNITWMINGSVLTEDEASSRANQRMTSSDNPLTFVFTPRNQLFSMEDPYYLTNNFGNINPHENRTLTANKMSHQNSPNQITNKFQTIGTSFNNYHMSSSDGISPLASPAAVGIKSPLPEVQAISSLRPHLTLSSNRSILQLRPVERSDAGLYTCFASNSEGDGQSNAGMLKVTHAPYCTTNADRHVIVVGRNSSVTLVCDVSSEPSTNVTFLWIRRVGTFADPRMNLKGGVVTGESPTLPIPGLIDLMPTPENDNARTYQQTGTKKQRNQDSSPTNYRNFSHGKNHSDRHDVSKGQGNNNTRIDLDRETSSTKEHSKSQKRPLYPDLPFVKESDVLEGITDPGDPQRSFLTLVATDAATVLCYAKNREGRSKVPCAYSIAIVDPPAPPKGCSVEEGGEGALRVFCEGGSDPPTPHAPGLSYVRSPQARTVTALEVWREKHLLLNTSSAKGVFQVSGLPGDAALQLLLFTVSPHARSLPLVLHLKTRPNFSDQDDLEPSIENLDHEDSAITIFLDSHDGLVLGMSGLVGCIIGAVLALVLIVTACVLAIIHRRRRNNQQPQLSTHNLSGSPQSSRTSSNRGSIQNLQTSGSPVVGSQVAESVLGCDSHGTIFPISVGSPATLPRPGTEQSTSAIDTSGPSEGGNTNAMHFSGSSFPLLMSSDASLKSYIQTTPTAVSDVHGGIASTQHKDYSMTAPPAQFQDARIPTDEQLSSFSLPTLQAQQLTAQGVPLPHLPYQNHLLPSPFPQLPTSISTLNLSPPNSTLGIPGMPSQSYSTSPSFVLGSPNTYSTLHSTASSYSCAPTTSVFTTQVLPKLASQEGGDMSLTPSSHLLMSSTTLNFPRSSSSTINSSINPPISCSTTSFNSIPTLPSPGRTVTRGNNPINLTNPMYQTSTITLRNNSSIGNNNSANQQRPMAVTSMLSTFSSPSNKTAFPITNVSTSSSEIRDLCDTSNFEEEDKQG